MGIVSQENAAASVGRITESRNKTHSFKRKSISKTLKFPFPSPVLSDSFKLVPAQLYFCCTSASVDLFHVVFGLPRFLFPRVIHQRECLVTLAKVFSAYGQACAILVS